MFGQLTQLPPIASRPNPTDDGSKGARVQLRTLCAYLLKDLLNQSEHEIEEAFANYGENLRDLYDNIIVMINAEPSTVRSRHGISRLNNIFDDYSGIALNQREFQAPEGKVFKHIGFVKGDGTFAPLPTLTAKVKAPPSSLKRTTPFPPGAHPNEPSGFISPTSPEGNDTTKWPKAKKWLGPAGAVRGINKIPCDTKDFRIGDGSVLPPARSKSYRDAAMQQGGDHGRSLPDVALPGRASSSFDGQPIKTDVPDITLDARRAITEYESSAWIPRINQAST